MNKLFGAEEITELFAAIKTPYSSNIEAAFWCVGKSFTAYVLAAMYTDD